MKTSICLFLVVSISSSLHAQSADPNIRKQFSMESLARTGVSNNTVTYGLPVPPGNVVGDYYWSKDWNAAEVELKDGKIITNVNAKYDIFNNELHFYSEPQIKFVKINQVKSMVWRDSIGLDHYFANSNELNLKGSLTEQLVEVLHEGDITLVKRMYTVVKEPDYNIALNSGSRDTKIFQKTDLYVCSKGKITKVKNTKSLAKLYPKKAKDLEKYVKENNIKNTDFGMASCVAFLDQSGS